MDHLCYLCLVFCHTFASVHCCLVVRVDLLALVCDCVLSLSHVVSWVRCGT